MAVAIGCHGFEPSAGGGSSSECWPTYVPMLEGGAGVFGRLERHWLVYGRDDGCVRDGPFEVAMARACVAFSLRERRQKLRRKTRQEVGERI